MTKTANLNSLNSLKTVKGLKIKCLNIRSILPKLDEIKLLVNDTKPHFLGLAETWLDDSITMEVGNVELAGTL